MAVLGKRKLATSLTRRLGVCAVAEVLLLVAATAGASAPAFAASSASDWPAYLNGGAHSSYNAAATSISTANIANLNPVWRWNPPASPNTGSTALLSSPTVSNGVIYVGAKDGYLFAIDRSTHATKWSAFLGLDLPLGSCGPDAKGILSTATVANNPTTGTATVYDYSPDGNVYALNAATGAVAWKARVYTQSTTANDYYSWGSPLVANGKVYVGISSDCDSPLVPGGLVAFDQATGAKVAQWNSLPAGQVGGSIWSSPAVLPGGDIVATTGNGLTNTGQPLYDNSIVRLDPNTLALKDHWQIPPSQYSYDGDFGASPTLFSATIAGVATPMVGVCNKNGYYYAFPQGNLAGGPTWRTQITIPYPGGAKECVAAAVWNGTTLIEGGGAATTINGTTYDGSVQALDPATGTPVWQTGLTGTILGSPAEDGGGVVSAPTYQSSTGNLGVYLLNATTGAVIGFVATPKSPLFGQAVFAGSDMLVGVGLTLGLTDYAITTPGPPITGVSPSTVHTNINTKVTLTGSGFSGSPNVFISGDGVTAKSVTVVSPTTVTVTLVAKKGATLGLRNILLVEPGSPPTADTCTACLTVALSVPPPVPTSVSPSSLPHGAIKAVATLTGTNFQSGAKVKSHSGITVATTFVSSTQLSLKISVAGTVVPGAYNLIVTNPDGGVGTCSGCLTVT